MATITSFKDDVILYGGNEVDDISSNSDEFVNWVNQALVNRHIEISALSNKWTTSSGTFAAKGFELALPTDWDYMSEIELFTDSDHQNHYDSFRPAYGVLRFDSQQAAGATFYYRYRQAPTVYTAMSDTLTEIANPRLKKILMDEVIGLFLQSMENLEMSSSMTNVIANADANS